MSPVEQIALTVNIALRREQATLDYYNTGSIRDSFATLPRDWTVDQIKQFQDYFDALMRGNLARRRMVKFMPSEFRLTETRQPPLKDLYDEWLARVVCYAFSVPASAFVSQVNRATSQTLRMQAAQEGLVPLKEWVKSALDRVIREFLDEPDLEFSWVGDDAVDPLQQAQTLIALVGAGIKTREEARAELGLAETPVAKFNPYHDEQGRFTTAEGAVEPGTHAHLRPDRSVEVADNELGPTTDAGGGGSSGEVAIGGPMFEEFPVEPPKAEPAKPNTENAPAPANAFAIPDRAPSPDNPQDYDLGYDPAAKLFRPAEVETAWRLQESLQQPLQRDRSGSGDWVGPDGTIYDGVGPPNWDYFNAPSFNDSIAWHLLKAGVVTVIDLTGGSQAQIAEVSSYLAKLPNRSQSKVIRLGF